VTKTIRIKGCSRGELILFVQSKAEEVHLLKVDRLSKADNLSFEEDCSSHEEIMVC
jgi:hypothetical protein